MNIIANSKAMTAVMNADWERMPNDSELESAHGLLRRLSKESRKPVETCTNTTANLDSVGHEHDELQPSLETIVQATITLTNQSRRALFEKQREISKWRRKLEESNELIGITKGKTLTRYRAGQAADGTHTQDTELTGQISTLHEQGSDQDEQLKHLRRNLDIAETQLGNYEQQPEQKLSSLTSEDGRLERGVEDVRVSMAMKSR